jgi:pyruvate formate lyase activating enzyme
MAAPLAAVAEYWRAEADGAVACELCPHACRIAEGRAGLCKVRRNEGGRLALPYYGLISSLAIDPIEKKPLHHFLPGSAVFSAGFVGCNMRCPFCQNWRISQEIPSELKALSPKALVEAALRSDSPSLAYTYSEPCVHFEFLMEAMAAARSAGIRNVLVTNGCLAGGPARELLALTDAVNVDLKSWSREAYSKILGGKKEAVLEFIRIASSLCSLEVTTLVVPGLSDSREGVIAISEFLASLSPDIPLHLSAYHPDWKHSEPSGPPELLIELSELARDKLRYVYIGNMAGTRADTLCPSCGATVIRRLGYRVDMAGLSAAGASASCVACGRALPITL